MNVQIAFQKKNYKDSHFLGKLFSVLIRLWTFSKYFHTNIIIGDTVYDLQSDGLYKYDIKYMDETLFDIITIPKELYMNRPENLNDGIKFLNMLLNNKVEYDWSGIFFSQFLWFIRRHSVRRYFCSEMAIKFIYIIIEERNKVKHIFTKEHHYCPKRVFGTVKNIIRRSVIK